MLGPLKVLGERVRRMGVPYHGWVEDTGGQSRLLHPNSGADPVPFVSGGEPIGNPVVLRNPIQPPDNRTAAELAADNAAGYDWQNFELLYLQPAMLLGSRYTDAVNYRAWVVCDEAGVPWIIDYLPDVQIEEIGGVDVVTGITIQVFVKSRFGVIGDVVPLVNRQLAIFSIDPELLGGDPGAGYTGWDPLYWMHSPSESGRQCHIHVYSYIEQLIACVRVVISGVGDLQTSLGLVAAVSVYKDFDDCAPVDTFAEVCSQPAFYNANTGVCDYRESIFDDTYTLTFTYSGTRTRPAAWVFDGEVIKALSLKLDANNSASYTSIWDVNTHTRLDCIGSYTVDRSCVMLIDGVPGPGGVSESYAVGDVYNGGSHAPREIPIDMLASELPTVFGFRYQKSGIPDTYHFCSIHGIANPDTDQPAVGLRKYHPVLQQFSLAEPGYWI